MELLQLIFLPRMNPATVDITGLFISVGCNGNESTDLWLRE